MTCSESGRQLHCVLGWGVGNGAKWAAPHDHPSYRQSVAARCHPALPVVGRSAVCRIHHIQWWKRVSQSVCAQIQTGRISGHLGHSESGVAMTTLGGYILQSSKESLGQKGDKETWGRNGKSKGMSARCKLGFECQMASWRWYLLLMKTGS